MAIRDYRSAPLWRRERQYRREARRTARSLGFRLPTLAQVALVELDAIYVPDWALKKAIRGLTVTNSSVWLRRIAANLLARIDREAGGTPKVTPTAYRRCPMCDRALLGVEAEQRFELDKKWTGNQTPCGPD